MTFDEAPVNRELLSDKVYGLVRRAILDGRQAPGSRLVESEIARTLGVSQAPVRDAIKRLGHEGLITSIPRRGSYVTEVSDREFLISRELRATVEQLSAELVAGNEDADTAMLRNLATGIVAAADAGDLEEIRVRDIGFHRATVELANSPMLVRVWSIMEPGLISQHILSDPDFGGDWGVIARDHVHLVDLLDEGNPTAAGRAYYSHASGRGIFPPTRKLPKM